MDTKYHNVMRSALETQRKEIKKQSRLSAQLKAQYVLEQLEKARINALNLSVDDMHGLCLYYLGNDQSMYQSSEHIETLYNIAKYDPRISLTGSKREHQPRIYRNASDEKEFFDWFFEQKSETVPLHVSEFIRKYYEAANKNALLEGESIDELVKKKDRYLKLFFEIP
ncbi:MULTISPECIES: hypothetical protein [unclassified Chryseobacterium]|uniref:hypothetical protein n=1 Tax=unclassified Chryseobacterium TaxID=2593645 RepID=UPI000D3982C1|nr:MULTISPECIES: hypothetical protein [unclassified Chryseobacterium]PTT74655.1 hypothetical protein DBR25_10340 [Chryseobacterium sp. HMWF001]PVV55181.1 hypothetical protein DD829_15495 [Chryseobacterium sp. HMWF035]